VFRFPRVRGDIHHPRSVDSATRRRPARRITARSRRVASLRDAIQS